MLLADADEATLTEITNYYAGNCSTNNSVVEGIIDAQETAVPAIRSTMTTLYKVGWISISFEAILLYSTFLVLSSHYCYRFSCPR